MEALLKSIGEIPFGAAFLIVALGVLALQLVAFRMARRRRPAAARFVAGAGAAVLALPIFAVVSVHAARATMLSAAAMTDASEKANALAAGMSGQINAIPFAIMMTTLAVVLWLAARRAARRAVVGADGAPWFPREALVALGLIAVALGGLQWATQIIKAFAGMVGVAPELKPALMLGSRRGRSSWPRGRCARRTSCPGRPPAEARSSGPQIRRRPI